jgi:catechol 2,3-dioxygenase-like lactoylglutathione lyase family enzyme
MSPNARLSLVVIDCPNPETMATFYAAISGMELFIEDEGWAEVFDDHGLRIAFQRVDDYRPPVWPGTRHPQQMHLDFDVDDLDAGELAVLAHGARKHFVQPGENFRVYLDPAGHPFCLVLAE